MDRIPRDPRRRHTADHARPQECLWAAPCFRVRSDRIGPVAAALGDEPRAWKRLVSETYPHPLIAREGWPFLAIAIAIAFGLSLTSLKWLAALAWLAVLFILQFFRDPPRTIPQQPNAVLSPADGRIVSVGQTRDPYLDRDALKVSVFMNVFNAHSNRSPVDGVVANTWYHEGSFVNASLDKA